jgi:hypothetical protein
MATRPNSGQREAVVVGSDPPTIDREVATQITTFVDDPQIFAAALVFPDVNDLPTLRKMAFALASEPLWTVTPRIISGTPIGDVVAFNVAREILMESGGTCPSESLVLGPFSEFPQHSESPRHGARDLRGNRAISPTDRGADPQGAPADVPVEGLPTRATFDWMWDRSKSERRRSLGGIDDPRAKAKVTFAIPMALAALIGCVP